MVRYLENCNSILWVLDNLSNAFHIMLVQYNMYSLGSQAFTTDRGMQLKVDHSLFYCRPSCMQSIPCL